VFRERARTEAERYGADPWVLVRELVQNARDAGARCVWFTTDQSSLGDRVICRDDGDGMAFNEARGFLFTLYASSKGDVARNAGRFGVGFWSVLRFAPEVITIRSRTAGGEGWEVRLDGSLELLGQRAVDCNVGTSVILERRVATADLEARVRSAVLTDAPFVRRRGRRRERLCVFVNEQPVSRELELPAPSSVFERLGLRGAAALAREPRVELFAFGLRVRTAAALDDLRTDGIDRGAIEVMPRGVAPCALLDSDRLQVLLARSDAAEDAELDRVVDTAYRELTRLIRRHLDILAPLPAHRRLVEWFPRRLRRGRAWLVVGVLTAAMVAGVGLGTLLKQKLIHPSSGDGAPAAAPSAVAYSDPGISYRGPTVDPLARSAPAIRLTYAPPADVLFFGAVRIDGWQKLGEQIVDKPVVVGVHPPTPCEDGCVGVELVVSAAAGLFRLPIPSGHLVDPSSVVGGGIALEVAQTSTGVTVVRFNEPFDGVVRYRTGLGSSGAPTGAGSWLPLPPDLAPEVRELEGQPFSELLSALPSWWRVGWCTTRLQRWPGSSTRRAGRGSARSTAPSALGPAIATCRMRCSRRCSMVPAWTVVW